jgi:predicted dehydrogenase
MKLKYAMIGGGPGSFIGAIHRIAANMDGLCELVAGSFSSNFDKSIETGTELGLEKDRIYRDYRSLIITESQRPDKVDFIVIVTPNHVHFEPTKMAIEDGFPVVLDKPLCFSLAEARELKSIIIKSKLPFLLTHTYTGYPMVKEARLQILSGKFGKIRNVYVEYPQGWLSENLESTDQKQAAWRTDPTKSGIAGSMGDIGTHAFNLAEYVVGIKVTQLNADINIKVEGRKLDDDGAVLLKFENEASGVLMATQVAAGEENNVKIRVFGEKGGIEWKQEDANTLLVKWSDKPTEIWRAGTGYISPLAQHNCRTPAGHPEGYLEAFANHYRNFCLTLMASRNGNEINPIWQDFPGIEEGYRGMMFIEKVIESGKSDQKWIALTDNN